MATAPAPSTVSVPEILAAALHLVPRANQIIRDVAAAGRIQVRDKASPPAPSSLPAGKPALISKAALAAMDPQTAADRRSQHLLIGSLKLAFPDLRIVGEEEGPLLLPDDPVVLVEANKPHPAISADQFPKELQNVPVEDVCIWIDPLDATREFTEGTYEAVTVLFGISIRGVPVAGIIGCPFWPPAPGAADIVVWGCVGVGVFGLQQPAEAKSLAGGARDMAVCISSSRSTPELKELLKKLPIRTIVRAGGAGLKILKVLSGECDAYIMLKEGTFRWDICAGEALLRAKGGGIVDSTGRLFDYKPTGTRDTWRNANGLIAYLDPAVGEAIVQTAAEVKAS